jgi:ABC-type spermidine/putrescine transport system permease subunit II
MTEHPISRAGRGRRQWVSIIGLTLVIGICLSLCIVGLGLVAAFVISTTAVNNAGSNK